MRDFLQYMEDAGLMVADYCKDRLAEAIKSIPHEYLLMTENELANKIKPTYVDRGLRVSFWREFERALATHRQNGAPKKITCTMIFQGFCSYQYFYDKFLKDPLRLAWMLTPMLDYQERLEVILSGLHEKLYEISDIEIYKLKTGRNGTCKREIHIPAAKLVMEAIKMIEDRVLGTAIQRTSQTNKNLNISGKIEKEAIKVLPSDVDKRIAELEKKLANPVIEGAIESESDD